MKYTTDQLGLIAILFKIQFADKTVGDFFPDCSDESPNNFRIGEMDIDVSITWKDIDFRYNDRFVFWFSLSEQSMRVRRSYRRIPIIDIVKMLSFEDKVQLNLVHLFFR